MYLAVMELEGRSYASTLDIQAMLALIAQYQPSNSGNNNSGVLLSEDITSSYTGDPDDSFSQGEFHNAVDQFLETYDNSAINYGTGYNFLPLVDGYFGPTNGNLNPPTIGNYGECDVWFFRMDHNTFQFSIDMFSDVGLISSLLGNIHVNVSTPTGNLTYDSALIRFPGSPDFMYQSPTYNLPNQSLIVVTFTAGGQVAHTNGSSQLYVAYAWDELYIS